MHEVDLVFLKQFFFASHQESLVLIEYLPGKQLKIMNRILLLALYLILMVSCKNKEVDDVIPDPQNDLLIKTEIITQSFVGNGVQWGGYDVLQSWTGNPTLSQADWDKLFLRVRFMRPPLVRLMVASGWNYMIDGVFDPSKSDAILIKILDFCEAEGIAVMLGEWGHSGGTTIDPVWLENSAKFVEWLLKTKKYSCIKYFNMVNEPNGDWSSINGNYDLWKSLINQFHTKLVNKGIDTQIKIIGPDIAIWDANLTSWLSNAHFDLGSKIGAYDIHTYPSEVEVRNGTYKNIVKAYKNAAPPEKEMLMTELGFKYSSGTDLAIENALRISKDPYASDDSNMFIYDAFYGIDVTDAMIQNMLAGYSGSLIWDLDDAMYNINGGSSTKLKRWGFWNILGSEKFENAGDENIRPWFYPVSLICRYFPTGTSIHDVITPAKKGLRAIAGEKNGKFTIAIVNSNFVAYDINLKMESGETIQSISVYKYLSGKTSAFTGKTDENGFAVPEETIGSIDFSSDKSKKINIPGQSFILLTNME